MLSRATPPRLVLASLAWFLFFIAYPGSLLAADLPKKIVVSVDTVAWPYSYYDKKEEKLTGFTVELLQRIAAQRNWNIELKGQDAGLAYHGMQAGAIHLSFPYPRKSPRIHIVPEPFGVAWGSLFVPSRSSANSLHHLKGYRVAIIKNDFFGNRFRDLSRELGLNLTYIPVDSILTAFDLVAQGKADAASAEEIAGLFEAKEFGLRATTISFAHTTAHFGVSPTVADSLGPEMQSTLLALKQDPNSYYYTLVDKWFGKLTEPPVPSWLRTLLLIAAIIGCCLLIFGVAMAYQLRQKQKEIVLRKASEAALEYQAYHDELTSLPNRRQLISAIEQEIASQSPAHKPFHIVFMDLDNFKRIVDTKGHKFGDAVLQAVATRLVNHLGEHNVVARFGGDEFVLLVRESRLGNFENISDSISQAFSAAFRIDNEQVFLTCSAGVSTFPDNGAEAAELLRTADTALYYGKAHGKATVTHYHPMIHQKLATDITEEALLREALETGLCGAHYQPIVSLETGNTVGAEALFRCFSPGLANTTVNHLIEIAEETGLITEIGRVILHSACTQLKQWRSQGLNLDYISVNLSLEQIFRTDVVALVTGVLQEVELQPESLVLEVTEAVFMKNPEQVMNVLNSLRETGVHLALDDFGTGYSSLAYMKSLPFSKLKLDRSFIRGLPEDHYDAELAKAIVSLGNIFGMSIIAEGVENDAQAAFLKEISCPIAQGYLFGKPVAASEFFNNHTDPAVRTRQLTLVHANS